MNREQALQILNNRVENNYKHHDYLRVTELAKTYKILLSGKDSGELLEQFIKREDDVAFEQRKKLFHNISPAVCATIRQPFYKTGRLDTVKKELNYEKNNDENIKLLTRYIDTFSGGKSLDSYLQNRFIDLSFSDPNAFIIVDFKPFDPRRERAKPYPVEVSSYEAIDYNYENGILEYLLCCRPNNYFIQDKKFTGKTYTMYAGDEILQYIQVGSRHNTPDASDLKNFADPVLVTLKNEDIYVVNIYKPLAGKVQAIRVGYKSDLETDGRTYVNPLHDALPYFMKMVKSVSEMDLTQALHVFPQKLQYVETCTGEPLIGCSSGKIPTTGENCRVCNGTGVKVHTSAQDILLLPKPKHREDVIPLEDMIKYVSPDIELLKFQETWIDKLEEKAIKTVFNSEVLLKTSVAQTATERVQNKDNMYDTLYPFAERYSEVWTYLAELIATFTDLNKGLSIKHKFPRDFKLKSISELINDLKQASDSQAPSFVKQAISRDIAKAMYSDDTYSYQKYLVRERFTPFLGKSEQEIQFILSSGMARIQDQVLWTHSDTIFDDLENMYEGFYLFTYEKQAQLVDEMVKTIIAGLPKAVDIDFTRVADDTSTDIVTNSIEEEAKAKLKGTVGGVQGILAIQEAVSKGTAQYNSALSMLMEIYGYSQEVAENILGEPVDVSNKVQQGEIAI